eukprot:scaffold105483_cov20-Tisochrysis_lutea.AAC.1
MDIAGSKGDRRALHAACPALRGTKVGSASNALPDCAYMQHTWTATKWIHNHPQGRFDPLQRAGACTDLDAHCAQEAANGGCSQDGMMGLAGRCRKTCGDCTVCQPNDIICYRSNLRSKADKNHFRFLQKIPGSLKGSLGLVTNHRATVREMGAPLKWAKLEVQAWWVGLFTLARDKT